MYADDLCIFSPSVAGLRKLTDCCAKYGELFNITYNTKKSFCMIIDNKPQDMKHFHFIHLPLPYTTKCKYLGHIINNNLTDDDNIARQKRCLYVQANVLARKCCLCNISTKIALFQAYCAPMYTSSLWCKLNKIASKALPSHTIIASEFYSTYPQDAVQALCLSPTTLKLLMNAFVHPYLVLMSSSSVR